MVGLIGPDGAGKTTVLRILCGGMIIRGRVTAKGDRRFVSLFLVNEQATPEQNRDEAWMFQVALRLETPDRTPIFLAREFSDASTEVSDPELPQLEMLYRDEVEFAVGHGTAVHVERDPADPRRAVMIETAAVPVHEVPRTEAPSVDQVPELAGLVLDMSELAAASDGELVEMLQPLVGGYGRWLDRQEKRIGTDSGLDGCQGSRCRGSEHTGRTWPCLRSSSDRR